MAKLAVIFFLFALCAVAMAGRIAREEPTKKPFEEIQGQLNNFIEQIKTSLNNPELQETFKNFGKQVQDATKTLAEKFQEQTAEKKA